jgi:hypothetical protein
MRDRERVRDDGDERESNFTRKNTSKIIITTRKRRKREREKDNIGSARSNQISAFYFPYFRMNNPKGRVGGGGGAITNDFIQEKQ